LIAPNGFALCAGISSQNGRQLVFVKGAMMKLNQITVNQNMVNVTYQGIGINIDITTLEPGELFLALHELAKGSKNG